MLRRALARALAEGAGRGGNRRRRSALLRDLRRRARIDDQVALNSAAINRESMSGVQTAEAESQGQSDESGDAGDAREVIQPASQSASDLRRSQQGENS